MTALALGWALLMPMLMALSQRLDGSNKHRTAESAASGCHAHV